MKSPTFVLLCASLLMTSGARAEPAAPDAKALITPAVIEATRAWLTNPIVPLSVNAQNERRGNLTQSEIDALDKQWRAEREVADKPLISATLSAPLSIYLLRVQAGSLGLYTELFVMDANGLNVGQSAITGDYWQGDEAKFQKTFPEGREAVFIDEPEWDAERQIWRAQLNMTLADPKGAGPIGAATIEINLTELQRRTMPQG
ncbi:hypothetical protein GCM10007285_14280 [Stappia taiwanensis]|nr:hypothetical protein [Stappia taiwanensis]GGE87858.1 hypothetical protein GCM10007285_14280 [Stappia taiwanensis]